jgi:two-component system, LytTR family, response regulator
MTELTAIIIDDEEINCNGLEWLLKINCPDVKNIYKCTDPFDAVDKINKINPHIIFLDIEMPGMNGIELLTQFPDPKFYPIFVTGHDRFTLKAFRFSAIEYLQKPIQREELIAAVNKVSTNIESAAREINLLLKIIQELDSTNVALPTSQTK